MAIEREVEERLKILQAEVAGLDSRLEFAERRVRVIRHQDFVENFLPGLTDLGVLGFISSHLDWKHVTSPANPSSGFQRIFADTDNSGHLTSRNSSGAEVDLEYLDADAIAAVEGEATLDLTGDITIASSKSLTLKTDGSGGGVKFGSSGDVILYRGDANKLYLGTGDSLEIVSGNINIGGNLTLTGTVDGVDIAVRDHAKYTDAEAISAVEGEATLDLTGDVTIAVGKSLSVDTIAEKGSGTGVTVDGLPIKDGTIDYSAALTDSFWAYSDFLRAVSADADSTFNQSTSGTGATWVDAAAEASHYGIWQGETGTTTTGIASLVTQPDSIIFSNGRIRLGAWIKTPGSVSDVTNRYQLFVGIMDGIDSGASTDGILLRYRDNINSGKWQAYVKNGGSASTADTGVTVTTNTWFYLEMEINAAGDSVEFFIDGSSVATIASGPATNSTAEMRVGILKSTGTSGRNTKVDAAYLLGNFASDR